MRDEDCLSAWKGHDQQRSWIYLSNTGWASKVEKYGPRKQEETRKCD